MIKNIESKYPISIQVMLEEILECANAKDPTKQMVKFPKNDIKFLCQAAIDVTV